MFLVYVGAFFHTLAIVASLACIVAWIWTVRLAFRKEVDTGFFCLIPIVALVYAFRHFRDPNPKLTTFESLRLWLGSMIGCLVFEVIAMATGYTKYMEGRG